MFQLVTISGPTGSSERPGFFQEEIVVRDGTEEPIRLSQSTNCAVFPHKIDKGQKAYELPAGRGVVCVDHISRIMMTGSFLRYQTAQVERDG